MVALLFAKYRGGTLEPYNEVILQVPCLYKGQLYLYIPSIYVTTDQALASGRELLGFPKKLATIVLDSSGAQFTGSLERHGVRVISISFKQGNTLFSVPLPANEKVVVPPPLRPADAAAGADRQAARAAGSDAHHAVHPRGYSSATSRIALDAGAGTFWAGEGSIEYAPSDAEPLAKLPVLRELSSTLFRGDMACYGGQMLTEME